MGGWKTQGLAQLCSLLAVGPVGKWRNQALLPVNTHDSVTTELHTGVAAPGLVQVCSPLATNPCSGLVFLLGLMYVYYSIQSFNEKD